MSSFGQLNKSNTHLGFNKENFDGAPDSHATASTPRLRVMYGRRPQCKRNLTIISEAFGCGHVFGLRCSRLAAGPDVIR